MIINISTKKTNRWKNTGAQEILLVREASTPKHDWITYSGSIDRSARRSSELAQKRAHPTVRPTNTLHRTNLLHRIMRHCPWVKEPPPSRSSLCMGSAIATVQADGQQSMRTTIPAPRRRHAPTAASQKFGRAPPKKTRNQNHVASHDAVAMCAPTGFQRLRHHPRAQPICAFIHSLGPHSFTHPPAHTAAHAPTKHERACHTNRCLGANTPPHP